MEPIGEVLKRIPIPTATSGVSTSTSTARRECSICGGAGYLAYDVDVSDPRFGETVPCECTSAELALKRGRLLEERSNLGPLRHKTFENFLADPRLGRKKNSAEAALQGAKTFAHRGDRGDEERLAKPQREWLLISGNHGTGKTHLAAAIANHRVTAGRPAVFIVVPDLLDRLRAAYSPSSEVSYDELFESARTTELLILDDLGSQSTTAWAQEKLYQIINERYNRRLPTVITTNLTLDDLELRLRSRIGDPNLADHFWIIGNDIRMGVDHGINPAAKAEPVKRSRGGS